jgi:tyrosine-protein kinase Etk/Wzc
MTEQVPPYNVTADETDEISLLDLLQVVADNLRLLILGPLAVGIVALGISFIIKPTFTATTTFLPPQQQQSAAASMLQSLGALGGLAGAGGIKSPADQYVALTGSRSVKDALIEKFKLTERYDTTLRQDARKELEKNTRISTAKNGLITVEVDDHEPQIAADMANAYVEELSRLMSRLALTEAQERRVFFEGQLKKSKEGLVAAETALKATGISESAVKASPTAAVGAVASLMAQVAAKEVQISAMRGYLVESAPDFQRAQTELGALRNQLSRTEKDTVSNGAGSDYVAKYRDFKYFETLFELMAKQFEIARIDESREGAMIQVVDKALPPERKSKPKRALIAAITTLAAGFALLLYVFVRQALRDAQQNPDAAQKLDGLRAALRRAVRKP